MRILYFADPHNSDTPPRMRMSSYTQDILSKQFQLLEPAKGCDIVIIGGDIFHQKDPAKISHRLVNEIGEIYRNFPKTYIVPGNHDFRYGMGELIIEAPWASLMLLPNIYPMHNLKYDLDTDIAIFGFGGGDYIPQEEFLAACEEYYERYYNPDDKMVHIGVFHASVAGKKFPFDTIPVNKVYGMFDVVCLGHLHDYQSMTDRVVAPGALSRGVLKLDENYDRKVGYALVDIIKGNIQTQFVPLEVKSPDEVFRIEAKEKEKLEQAAVGKLLNFIGSLHVPYAMSAEKLEERIREMENLDYDVRERAIAILRSL